MSGFSPDWLALREPVDHRSRDAALLDRLAGLIAGRSPARIVDLGCGAGSNLRAMLPRLGARQSWTLVDYDARLLAVARERIAAWADSARVAGDRLTIEKGGRTGEIEFRQADLARDLDAALGATADVVTASALFDLVSAEFLTRLAAEVARRRAVFYTVLTFDGDQRWTPAHVADELMRAAFNSHQQTDKGFGAAAGPDAPRRLREAFAAQGYRVSEAESPWVLGRADASLIGELAGGFAGAVAETGRVDAAMIAAWQAMPRAGAIVGHKDTLAVPA